MEEQKQIKISTEFCVPATLNKRSTTIAPKKAKTAGVNKGKTSLLNARSLNWKGHSSPDAHFICMRMKFKSDCSLVDKARMITTVEIRK
uniref:Uncharacterized protein n=1 Tax=Romanomermis culicivorax TaxID=13658 RepID=A0A915HHV8_ROMCU